MGVEWGLHTLGSLDLHPTFFYLRYGVRDVMGRQGRYGGYRMVQWTRGGYIHVAHQIYTPLLIWGQQVELLWVDMGWGVGNGVEEQRGLHQISTPVFIWGVEIRQGVGVNGGIRVAYRLLIRSAPHFLTNRFRIVSYPSQLLYHNLPTTNL